MFSAYFELLQGLGQASKLARAPIILYCFVRSSLFYASVFKGTSDYKISISLLSL